MSVGPTTRYTKAGDGRIAYQVVGDGPVDLLYMPSVGDCVDLRWDYQPYATFLHRLSSFSRLIQFDRRGVGASDPVPLDAAPSWERWIDDAIAVLDVVGSEQVAVFGWADAGTTAVMFAATQPQRTLALVLGNTPTNFAQGMNPGVRVGAVEGGIDFFAAVWGTEEVAAATAPTAARDPAFCAWLAKSQRLASSPQEAGTYLRWLGATDVSGALGSVRAPTLVLQREASQWITVDEGRYMADHIPGARFVVIPGTDLTIYTEPHAETLREIEEFITGVPAAQEPERSLATVVFTDIVGSTTRAAELGDRRWRNLLATHDALSATIVEQHRGRLIKMTGDGLLATFDGPGKAIQCATTLRDALAPVGIDIRVGLHTGEIELRKDDIGGIAVHLAARVLEHAGAGEVLVSGAVPMLVAGSGIQFDDRGEHELKGVPGPWRLFAVER